MAISGLMLGVIKTALKKSAKKLLAEEVSKGIATKALEEVATSAMSDASATILNRLKTAPSKALYDFASKDLGLPVNEVKQIIKAFNQTPKMKELSIGQNFKDLARKTLKSKLDISNPDIRIKDITRKIEEKNAENKQDEKEYNGTNLRVKGLLYELQEELNSLINGVSTAENKYKTEEIFDLDIKKYFDNNKEYTKNNILLLEQVKDLIAMDIERYGRGTGEELTLTEIKYGKWDVYSKSAIDERIISIKKDIKLALK